MFRAVRGRMPMAVVLAAVVTGGLAATAHAAPYAYVSDFTAGQVSQYDAAGGKLRPLAPARKTVGNRPEPPVVTPNGRYVYVPDLGSNEISQFAVDAHGRLRQLSPATVPNSAPVAAALAPDGKHLYVVSFQQQVSEYAIGAAGKLKLIGTLTLAPENGDCCGFLNAIAVSPDGRHAYVGAGGVFGRGTIHQLAITPKGKLKPLNPESVEMPRSTGTMAIAPGGHTLYAASASGSAIYQYAVGKKGTLTREKPFTVPAGSDNYGLVVSPTGRNVYVADAYSNKVSQYAVGAGGELTPLKPAMVAAGKGSRSVGLSPGGYYAFAANSFGNTISRYSIDSQGRLHPIARVPDSGAPSGIILTAGPLTP